MPEPVQQPGSPSEVFWTMSWLALQGFGGVLAIAQRVLCEDKRWLTRAQFVETLAVAQVLPGPNVVNLTLMIGDRFFGWRGALAALAGMLTFPLAIVIGLTIAYSHYAHVPEVAGALRGMGGAAAGMIIGTAIKLVPILRGNALPTAASLALGAATFIAIALLRWPLVWVLLGVGSVGCIIAWLRLRYSVVVGSDHGEQ